MYNVYGQYGKTQTCVMNTHNIRGICGCTFQCQQYRASAIRGRVVLLVCVIIIYNVICNILLCNV